MGIKLAKGQRQRFACSNLCSFKMQILACYGTPRPAAALERVSLVRLVLLEVGDSVSLVGLFCTPKMQGPMNSERLRGEKAWHLGQRARKQQLRELREQDKRRQEERRLEEERQKRLEEAHGQPQLSGPKEKKEKPQKVPEKEKEVKTEVKLEKVLETEKKEKVREARESRRESRRESPREVRERPERRSEKPRDKKPKLRAPGSYVLPVFAQHDRSNHAERQALIKVIARVQEASGAQTDAEFEAECAEVTGTVRLYASHTPCISCMACFCQFQRLFPKVKLCVDFDDWRDTRRMVEMARREEEHKKRGTKAPDYDCPGLSDMSDEEEPVDVQPTVSA